MSEHRNPEILKKKKEIEKEIQEKERLAYINPEISEQEKVKGNELFKKGIVLIIKLFIFNTAMLLI